MITVEPDGERDTGVCPCCGFTSRRVWGYVRRDGEPFAAYFIDWTHGHVAEHGANIDLILGQWGDGATAQERVGIALLYRLMATGSGMMVIDGAGRPAFNGALAGRALARSEVINTALATDVFAVADAILDQDERLEELETPVAVPPPH